MTLLEVVLALAVFSVAAVALVGTINQIGEAAFEAQQIRTIEQGIESLLDYYSKLPQITETEENFKPGADRIGYKVSVTAMRDLQNKEGRRLEGLFRIHVVATWKDGGGEPLIIEAETVRFSGSLIPAS